MKTRRKLGLSTQVSLRNIRIAVMGQDGVGKTGTVNELVHASLSTRVGDCRPVPPPTQT